MRANYRRVDAAAIRAASGDTAAPPQGQLAWLSSAGISFPPVILDNVFINSKTRP
jgi:hypothetical protein